MEINEKKQKKEQQALIIRKYQQYLKLEKSLSPNTLEAYLTDLDKLLSFLTLEGINILDVCLADLQRFAAGLHDIGIHPRSQARILSGIKSFFRFLIMADYLEADPSELLESPNIGLKLPEVLTVEEIDRIIATVDRSKAEGQRNRAILETLYSCGLRVSELVNLKLSDLYFDEGFIKVEGKGNKQRLIPISPRAINEIKLYFTDRNQIEVKSGHEDFVFISLRRGKR
ncbi:tyrosine-type recombinase/integrase, partial [Bacteroides finegoldii]